MDCPYCGAGSNVVDSRSTTEGVRRRRTCEQCKRRFTTYERVGAPNLKVIKRSQRSEPFDSTKLERVLRRVCRGRPAVGDEVIERMARDIEAKVVDSAAKSITSAQLLSLVLTRLAEVDRVAYNRLAADYLDEHGNLRLDAAPPDEADPSQLDLFDGSDGE